MVGGSLFTVDELVKSRKVPFFVIPAKAGIQSFQIVADHLDSGFHRSDDEFIKSFFSAKAGIVLIRHSGESRNPGRHQWINSLRFIFWQANEMAPSISE